MNFHANQPVLLGLALLAATPLAADPATNFAAADRELNTVYRRLRTELPAADWQPLLVSQRAWITGRDATTEHADNPGRRFDEMNLATRLRTEELVALRPAGTPLPARRVAGTCTRIDGQQVNIDEVARRWRFPDISPADLQALAGKPVAATTAKDSPDEIAVLSIEADLRRPGDVLALLGLRDGQSERSWPASAKVEIDLAEMPRFGYPPHPKPTGGRISVRRIAESANRSLCALDTEVQIEGSASKCKTIHLLVSGSGFMQVHLDGDPRPRSVTERRTAEALLAAPTLWVDSQLIVRCEPFTVWFQGRWTSTIRWEGRRCTLSDWNSNGHFRTLVFEDGPVEVASGYGAAFKERIKRSGGRRINSKDQ